MTNWTEADVLAHQQRMAESAVVATPKPKRHKYGVSPKEERTIDGIVFASKAESVAYCELSVLLKHGQIAKLELQPRYEFPCKCAYVADFKITWPDGKQTTVDVKGLETPVFKIKRKLLAYFFPDVKLEIWKK